MTKLLERGIKAVEGLPPDRQDLAGTLLLELANRPPARFTLTAEQIEDVMAAVAEADRGEFATPENVAEAWRAFER